MTTASALVAVERLVAIMARLRSPGGCEWDRAQDFASIAPYTIEEAYEVADAITRGDMAELCDELGDLLLQVVFHARMAEEAGAFTLADVADAICAKMERRHPHIVGAASNNPDADTVRATWESIKAAEKPRDSVLDGVASALPALMRAQKISARAARTGFDWPDAAGALAKVHEEIEELETATSNSARAEEAGDLLFAAVNYLRKLDIDAETALRDATAKFERRFRAIEATPGFATLPLDAQEALWQAAKARLSGRGSKSG
ncbi:nucleoside triphosphate pyrophosphohydrolase [Sandaracinobacteroides saxicola]|uniref:Nucleoside triphosphate pyrophosphohydrolase n=1 Tax=Sandaracinobacteroides saxicola TaxID=2759707 RepID=A0A7G5ILQ3_9SPHN|nr:nucleoside triphosphate pyrophosphohydrolase [Sandaracinobacteroides saxicola]QMW24295.1 nucleoside triphosphate pyrophosphohydrolase [Sandaracinobacteroides saxicola]